MWEESSEKVSKLRTGLTTGSCATACCVAAAQKLLGQQEVNTVSITLPRGKTVALTIKAYETVTDCIKTTTIKDAGDDPDVTHGAIIFVKLRLVSKPGIEFFAGQGVGTVTREGLALAVGEPAINIIPRQMMSENLQHVAEAYKYNGGFSVTVGIEHGESIALKTMNPRLGIVGGLSILGTTGIVRPFSCAAWIASIHQGIDVAKANGINHIAASTGNSSEIAIKNFYHMSDIALIEMGDFAGAVLKYLKKTPISKLSICGGIGKISKLANGHMDLNSRVSSIDFDHISTVAKSLGANENLRNKILHANTSVEALQLCQAQQIDLGKCLCEKAYQVARKVVPESVDIEVVAIDRKGHFVGSTNPAIYQSEFTH